MHTPLDSDADIGVDDYIPLNQAPAHIPGRPHRATVWRWSLRGLTRNGATRPPADDRGGWSPITTVLWIDEFLARCNGDSTPVVSPGRRLRQAAATSTLADMGVGAASA